MTRNIVRTYTFTEEDIRQALNDWLRKRDIPAPKSLGNTPCTTWCRNEDGSQTVVFTAEDEPVF